MNPYCLMARCHLADGIMLPAAAMAICTATSSVPSRHQTTLALESPVSSEALDKARPFHEIPGPKSVPLIGNLHRYIPGIGEYSKAYWHESQKKKFHQYGNIVREEIVPGVNMIHLYDPKDIEVVSRHEGKYPQRDFFTGMKALRLQKPEIYSTVGVAAGNGPDWHHMRTRSQKVMMRPQVMKQYIPQMNVISDDMVRRMKMLRTKDHHVPELMNELFKWALESVTYILFRQRMGCLDDNVTPDSTAQQYISAVNDFFRASARVELATIPIWRIFPSLSPSFNKLRKVHNFFFESAMAYVKEGMLRLQQEEETHDTDMSLIEMLLKYCSPSDASVMAIDSMAAGIDTTSLSVAYVLRNLAANPDAQKKLQEEVDRVLPDRKPLTVAALDQMPYMKACIKESMRISPTVQGTSRTLNCDIVLSGYRVPANTHMTINYYVSSVQESNFPDALTYKPERWIKGSQEYSAESFAFQPFGFGPRMCIGRRIADLEMFTLVSKIMQNFWVENKHQEFDVNFQLVLMIKSPLLYEFHDRNQNQ